MVWSAVLRRRRFAALLVVIFLSAAGTGAQPADLFTTIDSAVQGNHLVQTQPAASGKGAFREALKTPGVLIGFELGLGKFANIELIYAVRPLYLNPNGEVAGSAHGLFQPGSKNGKTVRSDVTRTVRIKAKAGYAVGGMTVRTGLFINGLALHYQRIDGTRLDPNDGYTSEWVGDRTGGSETKLDTEGMVAIGIHGKENDRACQSLGLIYLEPLVVAGADPKPAPVKAATKGRGKAVAPKVEPVPEAKADVEQPPPIQPEPARDVEPAPKAKAAKRAENRQAFVAPAQPAAQPEKAGFGSLFFVVVGVLAAALISGAFFLIVGIKNTRSSSDEVATDPATPAIDLPPELEARVRQELTPDEQIFWARQPSPRVTRLKGLVAAGGMLFFAAVAGLMLTGYLATAKDVGGGTWIIPGVAGLFVVIGLAGMVLAPKMKQSMARRTWYVITNRRALVGQPTLFGESAVDSYTPMQLQSMNRRDSWFIRGAGDLVFRTERRLVVTTTHYAGRGGSSSSVREKIVRYGFLGIDNVADVEKIVRHVLVDPLVDKCVR